MSAHSINKVQLWHLDLNVNQIETNTIIGQIFHKQFEPVDESDFVYNYNTFWQYYKLYK